ncbi:hypothetical protein BKA62DRAFT_199512 [Auriculariales sp. MPI-PUGE-AT-0066]|nr:hypothetical protein BKA62DRAFT_199512 [Auriculariales sp. MPI-PUGE-AT-0066]
MGSILNTTCETHMAADAYARELTNPQKDAITYYPPSDGNSDSCAKDIRKQRYIAKVKLHRNSEQSRDWLVVSYVWHDQRRNKAGLRRPGVSSATDHSLGLHLGAGYPVGSLHLHAQPISPVAATGSPAHIPGQELFPSTPTQTPYSPTLTSAQRSNPVTIVSPPKPNRPDIITLPRISELNYRTQDLASRFNGGSITNSPTPRSPIDEQVLRRLHAAP